MGMLNKSLSLYERDEVGKLIPQKVALQLVDEDKTNYPDLVGSEIKMVPLTRGELKKLFGLTGKAEEAQPDTDKDGDGDIILKYCKEPVYNLEDIKVMKPVVVRSIVRTVFHESGVRFDDAAGTKRMDENDEFGKNSSESDEKTEKAG